MWNSVHLVSKESIVMLGVMRHYMKQKRPLCDDDVVSPWRETYNVQFGIHVI